MSLNINSTIDVSDSVLEGLVAELPEELSQQLAQCRIVLKSAEPPSWFTLIAEMDWWLKVLGGYAAVYLASIANAAGKETWEKRSSIVPTLMKVAKAIVNARKRGKRNTNAELAIPQPDSDCSARLVLTGEEEEEIAKELSLFVHHLPEIISVLKRNQEKGNTVLGWVSLELQPDMAMKMSWMDRETLEFVIVVLRK